MCGQVVVIAICVCIHVHARDIYWHNTSCMALPCSYDTEVFFAREDLIQAQLDFLNQDLSAASSPEQRKKVPWIVAFGHRPMYCSNIDGDDCTTPESKVRAG